VQDLQRPRASARSRSSLVVPGLFISRRTPARVAPKTQRTPKEFLRIPQAKTKLLHNAKSETHIS
jgi:hypothetical protein